ncbi:hypothetical protein NVP1101O_130 [Vibrio phage 1.101.O._10N.261.45.C6]|nr:hypothetical protein NVP1101O_130 [Vibrio phage 1.101.O._10N.261.45.C6]
MTTKEFIELSKITPIPEDTLTKLKSRLQEDGTRKVTLEFLDRSYRDNL